MADIVDKTTRSRMMAGIKSKNTKPELLIRSGLHKRGFRYRLHDKALVGKPDLVFRKKYAVIFIHGCFWHGHDCHLFKLPSTRTEWWKDKIKATKKRDLKVQKELRLLGWRQANVWECALRGRQRIDLERVLDRLEGWLDNDDPELNIRGT